MSKRFEFINFLNAHDKFRDTENNKELDSFDIVKILNHYEEVLKDLGTRGAFTEIKYDHDEDDDGETVKQVIIDDEKYIDIEYFARIKADLEAKLAEFNKFMKDNNINDLNELQHNIDMCGAYYKDCEELSKQLAEKEKEIEQLHNQRAENFRQRCGLIYESAKYKTELDLIKEQHNQDKISFAVEKLEKVKEFFLEEHRDEEMDTDYIITKDAGEIADYLLDQIKQLKGVK